MANESPAPDSEPWELARLTAVECVCRRPTMYTRHGTIEEVAAYLDGYRSGLLAGASDRRNGLQEIAELDGFFEWLRKRLRSGGAHWCTALRQHAADDESGLQTLANAAREFRTLADNESGGQRA